MAHLLPASVGQDDARAIGAYHDGMATSRWQKGGADVRGQHRRFRKFTYTPDLAR